MIKIRRSLPFATVFAIVAVIALVAAPLLLEPFRLGLLAKYLCYAIVALGIGLAWGQGGMLTLGQGVFFGLGGYAMAMYLKLTEAGGELPDFMVWSGVERLPALWAPFANPIFALAMAVLGPVAIALLLGALVFRQRVRGAYFAILTQALAAALVILLVGQQGLTGGTNGMTNFFELFGQDLAEDSTQRTLYLVVAVVLGILYLATRQLVNSRYGRLLVAVRDGEDRVRFLGYDPALVKTVTFAASAGMAGLAGALFVPVVGIISPALLGVVPSLELVVAVAVGGRHALAGAVLGAVLMGYAKTVFSEQFADGWLYLQGALFILVMTLAPKGIVGLLGRWRRARTT
ncbi:urea ABC transporter permease subunit UrtC [Nonomuraea angiospora]|uniref:urea ABC transporter permease subunit UrtC n=1 Tax=Nonomuraea angiospora TaxID=46172 RepID=UPI0029B35F3E|nr:urea ABC transporter permease subunit UrtC [Nonomuraea angiospora]MDX3104893.1 urea ABC transporter permease subunit UrtC [Nonomuraea angiospora]